MVTDNEAAIFNSLSKLVSKRGLHLYFDSDAYCIAFKINKNLKYCWTSITNMLYGGRTIFKVINSLSKSLEIFSKSMYMASKIPDVYQIKKLDHDFQKIYANSIEEMLIKMDLLNI